MEQSGKAASRQDLEKPRGGTLGTQIVGGPLFQNNIQSKLALKGALETKEQEAES